MTAPPRSGGALSTRRVALVAAALLIVQVVGFHGLRHDDAFITFRVGQNVVRGRGVTFNPGQRQMVSSAPGHVVLSATVYAAVGTEPTPSVMSALGCVGWIAQAWAVLLLARLAFPLLGAGFLALAVALGAAWSQRFVALETNLAAAGVLWALWAGLARRHGLAFALSAVAGLLRPDAYLVLIPVGIAAAQQLRWQVWKPALWAVALSAPWFLFAALYFGTVLPTALDAKVQTVPLGTYAEAAVQYCGASLVLGRPAVGVPRLVAPGISGPPLVLLSVAVWGAGVAGAVLWVRRHRAAWVLPATGLLYLAAYLVLRARVGLEWHLYPVMLVLALCVLALLTEGGRWLARWPAGRVVAGVLAAVLLVGLAGRTARSGRDHHRAFWYGARHDAYRRLAHQLSGRAQAKDVVLVGEIGTLAYYTDLRLMDTGGLLGRPPRGWPAPRWAVSIAAYPLSPCPPPPVFRAASAPVSRAELYPRGHRRFVAVLCDLRSVGTRDRVPPRVTRFGVRTTAEPAKPVVTVRWAARDDRGLARVELWRTTDRSGGPDPKGWRLVPGAVKTLSGRHASGVLRDRPPPGRWWYGVHVVDRAHNVGYEPAPARALTAGAP